jgi:UDP-N-acetyl-2-amino-2-deoxyglucuronate dehydrogenase
MSENIRFALIGCGRVSGHHCRSIAQVEGASLAAVCDLIEEKAAGYGREFGVPHFTSYTKMLTEVPGIDVVMVVTPSGMHHEHAIEIMERHRKHVIVEKPTFLRPSQLDEAYRIADRLGLSIFPVFQNRHNRAVERVRRALRDGELGAVRVVSVRVRWCRPQRYYDLSEWRGTYAMDGGALTNQGVHHVDLCRHLAGEVTHVSAVMRTLGADIEVEDTVAASLTFASGAVGTLEVTTAARPDDFEASISLVCEKGLAQIGGIAVNELQLFTPRPSDCREWSEDFSGNVYGHGHGQVYRDVIAWFRQQKPYPIDERDCRASLKLLHAFYRADEAGTTVAVDAEGESPRLGRPDEELARLYRDPARATQP